MALTARNIDRPGVRRRFTLGALVGLVGLAALAGLMVLGAPRGLRLLLFIPFWLAALAASQARAHT